MLRAQHENFSVFRISITNLDSWSGEIWNLKLYTNGRFSFLVFSFNTWKSKVSSHQVFFSTLPKRDSFGFCLETKKAQKNQSKKQKTKNPTKTCNDRSSFLSVKLLKSTIYSSSFPGLQSDMCFYFKNPLFLKKRCRSSLRHNAFSSSLILKNSD